jgi:hypothetical protein
MRKNAPTGRRKNPKSNGKEKKPKTGKTNLWKISKCSKAKPKPKMEEKKKEERMNGGTNEKSSSTG